MMRRGSQQDDQFSKTFHQIVQNEQLAKPHSTRNDNTNDFHRKRHSMGSYAQYVMQDLKF